MSTLLVTGFEPFGGASVNPSAEVVRRFTNNGKPPDAVTAILPVDAVQAPRMITDLLLDHQPDLCLMLGQADGYAALTVERVAINLCDFRIPDNAGAQRVDEPIVEDGPAAYFSTAPVRDVVRAIRAAGVPVDLSLSAGAYLCNMVYYTALHVCATHCLPTRCLFIHLPSLPSQASADRAPRPTMALETMYAGVCAALRAGLGGEN
ncbi:pyroglutamyl-peptidase I [Roseiflexus castenholzii]|jgi:pyroglutamyl-peptidase|uniref:Pyroglutamyl-peptidase I n=1 Tax=Roseiflexus castenholzii (strain DSM 13941 / HLO8) TaxID=383372 RepID=A7NKW9_ROSCS|nr:pyroglutamyl-peptidase I [Roseiflexus castenholzii]ABU58139.1 pyrrolidone-carboxylate peptidase [Roseiflexus castenholzii DSM 13941]